MKVRRRRRQLVTFTMLHDATQSKPVLINLDLSELPLTVHFLPFNESHVAASFLAVDIRALPDD